MSTTADAIAKFADGTATEADVAALVPTSGMIMVQVHVRRTNPPKRTAQIHLVTRRRLGPKSSEDRDVVHVSGPRHWRAGLEFSVWSAWWRVDSLRLWCEAWARKPENRGVVLPWRAHRTVLRGTMETAGAGMPRPLGW